MWQKSAVIVLLTCTLQNQPVRRGNPLLRWDCKIITHVKVNTSSFLFKVSTPLTNNVTLLHGIHLPVFMKHNSNHIHRNQNPRQEITNSIANYNFLKKDLCRIPMKDVGHCYITFTGLWITVTNNYCSSVYGVCCGQLLKQHSFNFRRKPHVRRKYIRQEGWNDQFSMRHSVLQNVTIRNMGREPSSLCNLTLMLEEWQAPYITQIVKN